MSLFWKIIIGLVIIQLVICIITGIAKSRENGDFFEGFFDGIIILDIIDLLSDMDWDDFGDWD